MSHQRLGFLLGVCLIFCGCATNKQTVASGPKSLRISAHVDGSGRFVFTPGSVIYEHLSWGPPKEVTFDDKPWANLANSPSGWAAIASRLDLRKARVVQRKGRDVIALEHTPTGFDLYVADAPNGAADYEVTVSIPRRK